MTTPTHPPSLETEPHRKEEVLDFIIKHFGYLDRDTARRLLDGHLQYKTCMILWDRSPDGIEKVVAFCRWNISEDGLKAYILELAIDKDFRNNNLMRRMLLHGLKAFPKVEKLRWERAQRDDRKREFTTKEFLNA